MIKIDVLDLALATGFALDLDLATGLASLDIT